MPRISSSLKRERWECAQLYLDKRLIIYSLSPQRRYFVCSMKANSAWNGNFSKPLGFSMRHDFLIFLDSWIFSSVLWVYWHLLRILQPILYQWIELNQCHRIHVMQMDYNTVIPRYGSEDRRQTVLKARRESWEFDHMSVIYASTFVLWDRRKKKPLIYFISFCILYNFSKRYNILIVLFL